MKSTGMTNGRLVAGAAAAVLVGGALLAGAPATSAVAPNDGAPARTPAVSRADTARPSPALFVQVEAAAGFAAAGNASPADILVLVTDRVTGRPVTTLAQANFVVINHFSHSGQTCGFSNNIVTFSNVGTGAYHVQVAPAGCNWAVGDFLLQVIVSSGARNGQAPAKFTVADPPGTPGVALRR